MNLLYVTTRLGQKYSSDNIKQRKNTVNIILLSKNNFPMAILQVNTLLTI